MIGSLCLLLNFFHAVEQETSGNKPDNAYILAFSQYIFVAFPQNHYL